MSNTKIIQIKKQYLLTVLLTISFIILKSQNTIPTTTVTGTLKINDSLNVNKNIISKGEVIVKDILRAKKDILVDGNAIVDDKLKVSGKSTFKNDIIIKKSILFDGGNELSYIPATSTTRETFYLGNSTSKVLPYFACPNPYTNGTPLFINNGAYISRVATGMGSGSTNSSLSFYSAPWNGDGIIEVEGVNNQGIGTNALLINLFCGRNTAINTGWDIPNGKDGGTVYLGAKVDMQNSLKLGWTQSGAIDLNTSIEINQNANNGNGVKINTWNTGLKAYSILRNDNKNTFIVYGSGRTQIGVGQPKVSGAAENAMLSVDGLILAKEVKIAIANTHWADYVFEKKYKLMPIKDLESYIIKNKHLPEVPSADEVENNGINVVEINATLLKKIEELTLYLIEQNKRIDALEKENADPSSFEANQNATTTPTAPTLDFTITTSDINYPIGTTWVYNLITVDEKYVNMSSVNPNLSYSYTTPASYSVSVIKDSIISSNITAKVLLTAAPGIDNISTYIREVVYYDPSDLKWHDLLYEKYNGGPEIINCLGIDLPLKSTSAWQNTHTTHPSTGIDSCFSRGFESANCGLGNIKCIKFENKFTGTNRNTYWYNTTYGKVRAETLNAIFDSGNQTYTTKASTITLTNFHY